MYVKAGLKNTGVVFLLTDAQVPDEKFLVLINDLLASGEIPDLFPADEVDNIISALRNEVKGAGIQDTRENCWSFFIDRVRRQLKVIFHLSCTLATNCFYVHGYKCFGGRNSSGRVHKVKLFPKTDI